MAFFTPKRIQAGTPAGGRFAASRHDDSGLALSSRPRWEPLGAEVDGALEAISMFVEPEDETFPAVEHAAALHALHDLADALLARQGVAPRRDDELAELRTVVAEHVAGSAWDERDRDLVLAALGDPTVARTADRLARNGPGDYRPLAVHYLIALERHRQEGS